MFFSPSLSPPTHFRLFVCLYHWRWENNNVWLYTTPSIVIVELKRVNYVSDPDIGLQEERVRLLYGQGLKSCPWKFFSIQKFFAQTPVQNVRGREWGEKEKKKEKKNELLSMNWF